MAKTPNHSLYDPHFEEFTVLSLADFMNEDRDEMLFCPIIRTEQFNLFVLKTKSSGRKRCFGTPFCLGLDR